MKKRKSKDLSDLGGMVYSTEPSFDFSENLEANVPVENSRQHLLVKTDKKNRKGKIVTLISGFIGEEENLLTLCKTLKGKCGSGGSAKEGQILIQGDFKKRISDYLSQEGFNVKISG
jgi:translation initiation factor 1